MTLKAQIEKLQQTELERPNKILSMYVNTDPANRDQTGGEWKIEIKNSLKNFETYLKNDKAERENFQIVKDKVKRFVQENEQQLKKSFVFFASADGTVDFAKCLQLPVDTEISWEETAKTEQLEQMYEKFPELGVILVQKNQVKTIHAEMGEIKETKLYEMDLDTERWKVQASPQRALSIKGKGGKGSKKDSVENRLEANQKRWYKSLAPDLDKLAKDQGWRRIHLVGNKEEAKLMEGYMQKQVDKLNDKNLFEQEEHQVLNEVLL